MTLEKLKRVIERLREEFGHLEWVTKNELSRAIMFEIGTDDRTIYSNTRKLKQLGWIKADGHRIFITGRDEQDL